MYNEIQLVREQVKKSNKDIWLTKKVKEYFVDTAKAILDLYGSDFRIVVEIIFDPAGPIASTSFNKITLNAGCPQVQNISRIENQFLYLKGLMAHELSHILYMDKNICSLYYKAFERGSFFPRIPSSNKEVVKDILDTIKNKESASKMVLFSKDLVNIEEDGFGENTFLENYYGNLSEGMKYMRKEFLKGLDDVSLIEEIYLDESKPKWAAVCRLLLQYCLYHKVKNFQDKDFEVLKELEKSKEIIHKTLGQNFKERLNSINELIVIYWDLIKPFIESADNSNQNNADGGESNENQNTGSSGDSDKNDAGDGNSNDNKSQGNKTPKNNIPDLSNNGKPKLGEKVGEGFGDNDSTNHASHERASDNMVNINQPSEDFSDIIEAAITEIATKRIEQKTFSQTQLDGGVNGDYRGCKTYTNRPIDITDKMIREYENYEDDLFVSRNLQRRIKKELDDKRKGGKQSNLYFGRKVEVRSLIRNDGKCFSNNKLPQLTPRICVYAIIDESGSMSSETVSGVTRIQAAKRTAVVLEDFCREMKFPIEIIGTTADDKHMPSSELTIYSSFDSIDGNDRYRLMNIKSKACNRDGAALNYAFNRLARRQEEIKILFTISDGRPYAYNYGGEMALKDIRAVLDKCYSKRIVVMAAAVGNDKEEIENIYGDNFVNISDMERLPDVFISKIKRFLKR